MKEYYSVIVTNSRPQLESPTSSPLVSPVAATALQYAGHPIVTLDTFCFNSIKYRINAANMNFTTK